MNVVFVGTIISSFYGFRADLIRTLLKNLVRSMRLLLIYARIPKKIEKLEAIPNTYRLNCG